MSSYEAKTDESFLGFSTPACINAVALSPQSPHQPPNMIPVFEIKRGTLWWLNSSLLFFPSLLVSLWLNVFYLSAGGCRGGWGKGRRREEAMGGFCGTSHSDKRGLSLFYSPRLSSFQLFEAPHQTGLNSRRDTICLSFTTSTTGISPTHPSILPSHPIYLHSSIYLLLLASVHPFTRSQCSSGTTDRRPEWKKNRSSSSWMRT